VSGALHSAAYRLIQSAGRLAGVDIRRNGPSSRDDLRLIHFMNKQRIDLLLDIGANRGQFAGSMFAGGYRGRIVSFEAMPDAHADLVRIASSRAGWTIAQRAALSDARGEVEFYINVSDATSSLLPASASSQEQIPGTKRQAVVLVPTLTLDEAAASYNIHSARTMLKIDVQGGEAKVLAGAVETLRRVAGLVIELSLTELYEGQALALEILAPLLADGFELIDIGIAYRDPRSYRLQQIDAVLFHRDRLAAPLC
jgi:FkbM family methyltransferase